MSNARFCEKCQGSYLLEDGHACPNEPVAAIVATELAQPAPEQQAGVKFAIAEIDGDVVIKLSKPMDMIGMPPAQAIAFGQAMIRLARKVQAKNGPRILRV